MVKMRFLASPGTKIEELISQIDDTSKTFYIDKVTKVTITLFKECEISDE